MKILFAWIAPMLNSAGGAERVVANFANNMFHRGHEVNIMYCTEREGHLVFPLENGVNTFNLVDFTKERKFESKKPSLAFKLHRELLRPFSKRRVKNLNTKFAVHELNSAVNALLDKIKPELLITVDYRTTAVFIKEARARNLPVIAMCHANAENVLHHMSEVEFCAWNSCNAVQVLMSRDKNIFEQAGIAAPIIRIPNAVPQYELPPNQTKEPLVVDVARIEKNTKRQHLLIEAFGKVSSEFPEWKLELWGEEQTDGRPYTKEMEDLIHKYHLEERVNLCGNTDNVLSVYRRASIFAFPSAFEGFGLAMTEAMSAGLPVVAYKSCPAVNELVKDGKTGLLVDDGAEALAEGLRKLMKDQELREEMGRAAHEEMHTYAPEKIWDQWEALMKKVIAEHGAKK